MGIDARLESEFGQVQAEPPDSGNLTKRLVEPFRDSDTRCLRFIDLYGDTTFNRLQLPVLISELKRAIELTSNPVLRTRGEAVLALAHRASSEGPHIYLKFVGD
jgi:hypothetical protein